MDEPVCVGTWVHTLVNCRTEGYARVIEIDGDYALLQSSNGHQYRQQIAALHVAKITPLLRFTLENEFGPPTAAQRLRSIEADIVNLSDVIIAVMMTLADFRKRPHLADRLEQLEQTLHRQKEDLSVLLVERDRLRAEIAGKTVS